MATNNWQTKRKQAAQRRRRIIFNNDGGDAVLHVQDRAGGLEGIESGAKPGTPEWFWAQRCNGLEESQVDSIFYCTAGGSFNSFCHDTRVGEVFDGADGLWVTRSFAKTLIEQGRDCLQLMIDFGRRDDKEVFWSLRMNDIHDNWTPAEHPNFKKEHPELLLFKPNDVGKGRIGLIEPHMYATALDYGRSTVRDRQFDIIADVCRRYDIDGIELDFMRQPVFFRPTMEARPVEQEHLALMTEFLQRIRRMTEEVGRDRNRPLLVACRVPCRESSCNEIGLDIQKWLSDDLLDIVISSIEFEPFTGPVGEMVELGHRYDVPVYGDISRKLSLHFEGMRHLEAWIGSAMNVWNAGADGVYTFNLFEPRSPVLRTIGDPTVMETMDKVYLVDNIAGRYRTWEHVLPPTGRLPLELEPNKSCSVELPIGDDIAAQAEIGKLHDVHLRIYLSNFTHSDEIACKLNGHLLDTEVVHSTEGVSPVVCSTFLLRARPEPASLRKGINLFEVSLKNRCDSAPGWPNLVALQMPIRYKNNVE
jgi:hypothetical protein